jgi:hypothetical protein
LKPVNSVSERLAAQRSTPVKTVVPKIEERQLVGKNKRSFDRLLSKICDETSHYTQISVPGILSVMGMFVRR